MQAPQRRHLVRRRRAVVAALVAGLLAGGCSRTEAPGKAPAAAAVEAKPAAEGTPEGPAYELSTPAASLKRDSDGSLRLVVTPRAPWKINTEYPNRLEAKPGGPVAAASGRVDGDAFEVSEKALKVALPVRASEPGAGVFSAEVRFAVCTESTCVPHTETVSWEVAVSD